jgi:superfamily II DNA or RNA helicase
MQFRDITIRPEYRTLVDNLPRDFYIPLLRNAVLYQRAVGFFSSSVLALIAVGVKGLWKNGGKIQIVVSPHLSAEDVESIRNGYAHRDQIVKNALLKKLREPQDATEKIQLNVLANLIAEGVMDLKIAVVKKGYGIFHDKIGVITDSSGSVVAFAGSMNETAAALSANHEQIEVFCSWKNEEQAERVARLSRRFKSVWTGKEMGLELIDASSITDEIVSRYRIAPIGDYNESELFLDVVHEEEKVSCSCSIPSDVDLHDYQVEAISKWEANGFCGVFDMATGTGKTFTGLAAVVRLCEKLEGRLAVVIVAPFQHLVEQWVEDILRFGMMPIIGHSASTQKDWFRLFDNAVRDQNLKIKGSEFFCFVCTNATFSSEKVQRILVQIRGDVLLIADEAHNLGAAHLQTCLTETFTFRLALSATITRHHDEEGTNKLFSYFGPKCIEYSLGQAIADKKLTPYRYYPVIVALDEDEREEYEHLTFEMGKCLIQINGKVSLSEHGKRLAIKRARVVAAAKNKIDALANVIQPYKNDTHILVYCGACKLLLDGDEREAIDDDERRQISVVSALLGNQLGMICSHFTSREDASERAELKRRFTDGDLQVLVAIKCLDEGVNIPAIKTAFILASTTNPKEYIQRRGRVLRLSSGKEFAELYDFITVPIPLNDVIGLTANQLANLKTLVKNEVKRAEEFASLAMNAGAALNVIGKIKDAYRLYEDLSNYEEINND